MDSSKSSLSGQLHITSLQAPSPRPIVRQTQGPTIASAPSVEHEDYRSPRPSYDAAKNGKSFDFGGHEHPACSTSDSNAFVKNEVAHLMKQREHLPLREQHSSLPTTATPSSPPFSNNPRESHGRRSMESPSAWITGSLPKEIPMSSPTSTHSQTTQQASLPAPKLREPLIQKRRDSSFQEVSADFLRLNGSRQQFRNLLSTRKKMGQMPPAYTRVDCSRDSLDSQTVRPLHHGPVITVEDTGSQLKINRVKTSITSSLADSTNVSFDRGNNITFAEPGNGSIGSNQNPALRRNNSRYGVPINSSAVKLIYRHHVISVVLRGLLLLSTLGLLVHIVFYHLNEIVDASTRTLAALNRIQVNFSFVMKTLLDQNPLYLLTGFTIGFWLLTSWTFVQCERYGNSEQNEVPSIMYSNALWFIAITFMLNGYGDIVPQTHAGRIIAIFVGVVVLQHTWYIHKYIQSSEPGSDSLLRFHQRRFLRFRAIKNEIRVFGENNSANSQQLVAEMHSSMQKLLSAHEEMRAQIEVLQRAVRNHYAHHGNCSSRVVFFDENAIHDRRPIEEGTTPENEQMDLELGLGSSSSPGNFDSKGRRAFTIDSH